MRRLKKRSRRFPHPEALESRTLLSTLIAVVDTGVDLTPSDSFYQADSPYYDLTDGYDAYSEQTVAQGGPGVVQDNGWAGHTWSHGTAVTNAVVAAIQDVSQQPGAGNPDVRIVPIRDTISSGPNAGQEDYAALIRGIYYAANLGAKAINVSVGYPYYDPPISIADLNDPAVPSHVFTMQDAIAYARSKGSIVVTAAGNDGYQDPSQTTGVNIDGNPSWPIYPAFDHRPGDNMIVAASADPASGDALWPGSNWGPVHVDLAAPMDASNNLTSDWHTSYAAGYASGIAGAIAALRPDFTYSQVIARLNSTVQTSPQLSGKLVTGGVISPANAVHGLLVLTVANPAAASPSAVNGTSTTLSVLGSDAAGASSLTYNWVTTAMPSGVATPTFSANHSNAARDTTATFSAAGSYTFQVNITDGAGFSAASRVTVNVQQTATSIAISPSTATVADGNTQTFAANVTDQFGAVIASPALAWSVNAGGAGGTIDATGKYTAPASGTGTDTITATSGTASATSTVTVTPASQPPNVYLIDNSSSNGFSETGNWIHWYVPGEGYLNNEDTAPVVSGAATATASWTFTGLQPGLYQVWATWEPVGNQPTATPFRVYDGSTLLANVPVNQANSPNPWFYVQGTQFASLGAPFAISSHTLVVTLANNASSGRFVQADAVMIERVGPQVIDNSASTSASAGFRETGAWTHWNVPGEGYSSSDDTAPATRGAATAKATWTFTNLAPGEYQVWTSWQQAPSMSTASPFTISDGTTVLATATVDQTVAPNGSLWYQGTTFASLGQPVDINSGTLVVTLSNNPASGNNVEADGVLIREVGPDVIDNADSTGFSESGGWTHWNVRGVGYHDSDDTVPVSSGPATASATWTFNNLLPGYYQVWTTWRDVPTMSTASPFAVSDGTTLLGTVPVDQSVAPIGSYWYQGAPFAPVGGPFVVKSGTLVVSLSNNAPTGRYVEADAVVVRWVGSLTSRIGAASMMASDRTMSPIPQAARPIVALAHASAPTSARALGALVTNAAASFGAGIPSASTAVQHAAARGERHPARSRFLHVRLNDRHTHERAQGSAPHPIGLTGLGRKGSRSIELASSHAVSIQRNPGSFSHGRA